jgi:hypothetical protein
MNSSKYPRLTEKTSYRMFLVVSVLLLIYTSVRAYLLSFSIDESYTFLHYTGDTVKNIFDFSLLTPNNSVVNTLLTKFFYEVFGLSEFTLRLHSLLAHGMYLVFSWLILRDIKNNLLRLGCFILININPYVLDFFTMSRGHAISWACVIGSLYYLKVLLEPSADRKLWHLFLAFFFAGVAALASFTILNYLLSLFGIYLLLLLADLRSDPEKRIFPRKYTLPGLAIASAVTFSAAAYCIRILIRMKHAQLLIAGGTKGFLVTTVLSVIEASAYRRPYAHVFNICLFAAVILIYLWISFYIVNRYVLKKESWHKQVYFIVLWLLSGCIILSMELQHFIMGINFITDRAAIYIWIIFMLLLFYWFSYCNLKERLKNTIVSMVSVLFIIHFAACINFGYVLEWRQDACNKAMMRDLAQYRPSENQGNSNEITLKSDPYFLSTLSFYKNYYQYPWLRITTTRDTGTHADLIFISRDSLNNYPPGYFLILKEYPYSGTVLLKNKDGR